MVGNDSADFLHRISTNDFRKFSKDTIQPTILITEKGRMLDVVFVLHCGEYFLLFTSPNNENNVIQWLQKFIIMEDIQLEIFKEKKYSYLIFENTIKEKTSPTAKTFSLNYYGISSTLLISDNNIELPYHQFDENEFEYFRIQNGIPAIHKEISEHYNPLELNLWNYISFKKGCYIGQEVIARLDTYDKIQRRLCTFKISENLEKEKQYTIIQENEEVGTLTSNSSVVGLGLIKTKFAETEKIFLLKENNISLKLEKNFQEKK